MSQFVVATLLMNLVFSNQSGAHGCRNGGDWLMGSENKEGAGLTAESA